MRAFLLILALSLIADAAAPGGTITGRVVVYDDHSTAVKASDVYVYLEAIGRKRTKQLAGSGITAKISQKNEEFVPHVVVVPVGAEVTFPNLDHQEHNVFSNTDPPGGFDLKRYNHDPVGKKQTFLDPFEIDIFCDIHRKMQAKIKVIDSAFYAEVKDGSFTLSNVAPGTYKVVAWLPDSDEVKSEKLVVTDGGKIVLEHDLHLHLGRPKAHLRKDGTPYPCSPGYPDCPN